MKTPEEPAPDRRTRYLKGAGLALALVVGGGVVFVTRSPQVSAKMAELGANSNRVLGRGISDGLAHVPRSPQPVKVAELAARSTRVDGQVVQGHTKMQAVQGHTKMQAIGPNWSEHKRDCRVIR